ncbi:unnamed protein product [Cuscuta campestris]|uniref:E2 ubiquitin-conjugating enzyme n=1 Tax=Cuscuta campestris TaxID=132261 RepID=A0A484KSN9_9ASTE|nr:unnamed protein product [Cuscuta campestris]
MESPPSLSRYATKKIVFQGGSSTDEDVIEIPPPINRSSKILKQKEISVHDVIDLDIEDDYNEARLGKGSFLSNGKEKVFIDLPHGPCGGSEITTAVKGVQTPKEKFSPGSQSAIILDDFELFGDEYYGESMCGSNKNLLSHSKVRKKVSSSSGSKFGHRIIKPESSVPALGHALGKRSDATDSSLDTNSRKKSFVFPHEATSFGSHNLSAPVESSLFTVAAKSSMTDWMNFPLNSTNYPTIVPSAPLSYFPGFVPAGTPVIGHNYATATGIAPNSLQSIGIGAQSKNIDEALGRFRAFKKFDMVQDDSGHHYSKNASKTPSKALVKRIQEEWKSLKKDLPDKIFVRVYESKMDLLRAVITGAAGTPYHDGLFFFDVYFPFNYPNVPPKVYYHSGGLRINPNLYECGKVCLSLLNTWSGSGKEKWIPLESTILQVLVSIQGLILNAKPYFNEPGYASSKGTPSGEKKSLQYNENTFILNLRTMIYSMQNPPKHFEDFVVGYFVQSAKDILVACKTYLDGAPVGSLVSGGVQDVDEGDKSCSDGFKKTVAGFIRKLVKAFTMVGAKDCDKFLYLAGKATSSASVPALHYY